MSESTLSIAYHDLCATVGGYLGYGRDSSAWTTAQTSQIDEYIQAGVRQFYFPPAVEGIESGYEWSFMRPTTTLVTVSGEGEVDLPDDFSRLIGDLTFEPEVHCYPIPLVGQGLILARLQADSTNSRPEMAATRYKDGTGTTGQRQEIMFYPTPDDAYTLTYKYETFSGKLTAAAPYPLGGMKYAPVLESSCVAIAEQRANGERGVYWDEFTRLLAAAVKRDRQAGAKHFGAMGENDNMISRTPRRGWGSSYPIDYKGESW